MKKSIDDIIASGVTQQPIPLRKELWHRLERRLEYDAPKKDGWHWGSKLKVAASIIVLMILLASLWLQINRYKVIDLDLSSSPYFTKDEIQRLEKYHEIQESIFVSRHAKKS